ncbi:hypothetical protein, partial [Salmonella sp. s51933]|uniref:hypothetical protein n=1 Tax=Salmonella sp. s51933 TaxID=3160127 RepID=UPI00375502BB
CMGRAPSGFSSKSQPWSESQLQGYLNANKKLIYAEFHGTGGYGRPLVTLMNEPGAKSFNTLLMEYGYASKYY